MKRTAKKKSADGKVRFRKIGGGSFVLGKRRVKPNETFFAFPHEIPKEFRDVIIPLEEIPEETAKGKVVSVKPEYRLQRRGTTTWYDVVNENDKVMNEKALHRNDALDLIKDFL